jgi:hypothetical protein
MIHSTVPVALLMVWTSTDDSFKWTTVTTPPIGSKVGQQGMQARGKREGNTGIACWIDDSFMQFLLLLGTHRGFFALESPIVLYELLES